MAGRKQGKPTIAAGDLARLLAAKHADDVFVPECKTGPTVNAAFQRMDAWVMARSWRHPLVTAYEIKVSRQDWLGDGKWRGYLPYCNEFMFCCPPGVIEPSEVPEEAGLLVCSANATRLYRKKRAPYRDVLIPEEVFRYVLYSRVQVVHYSNEIQENGAAFFRNWLASKQDFRDLGHRVSKAFRKRLAEEIHERDVRQNRLERELAGLRDVRRSLVGLGFDNAVVPSEWAVERRVAELRRGIPDNLNRALSQAEEAIARLRKVLREKDAEKVDWD